MRPSLTNDSAVSRRCDQPPTNVSDPTSGLARCEEVTSTGFGSRTPYTKTSTLFMGFPPLSQVMDSQTPNVSSTSSRKHPVKSHRSHFFTAALNIAETLLNLYYLTLQHVSHSPVAPLVGLASAVMTLWKTVLYWAQEYYCGFCAVGHNDWWTLFWLWIVPNG